MRHGVNDVVNADADPERGVFLGIFGIVGVLPGIAEVHVVADGDHEPAFVVIDAAPMRHEAVFFRNAVRVEDLLTRHLVAIVQVENSVEDRAAVLDVDDGPVGKHAIHAGNEDVPLVGAVEIVAHEEAAAEQKIA